MLWHDVFISKNYHINGSYILILNFIIDIIHTLVDSITSDIF